MKLVKDKWNKATDKPYDMCLRSVREDLRISGDAYRLYVTLLNGNTDPKVGKVYTPTEKSLAQQFKVASSTIARWLNELKHYGYITILGNKNDGYVMYVSKQSMGIIVKKEGFKNEPISNDKKGSKMNPSIDVESDEKGSKMNPSMGSNLTPIIKTYAAPPPAGSSICQQAVPEPKEEKVEIGSLGLECVTHSPSAATPSGQPTEMLHTPKGIGRNEVIEMTPEEIETLSKSLPF